ncbi:MAG TPA: hypothetical protein VHO70_16770 [Chitinispirillaceae bacterium]|nr:hypothetical protein [Chitinispirillaceae bacterium]
MRISIHACASTLVESIDRMVYIDDLNQRLTKFTTMVSYKLRTFFRIIIATELVLCVFSVLKAQSIDTTIYANGGPGPYCISTHFIDTSTLSIHVQDSSGTPPWNWIKELNSILFFSPIDSGIPIRVSFKTDYYGLPKVYSLFPKTFFTPSDSVQKVTKSDKRFFSINDNEQLSISGYKSVGVSVGTFGQINIAQGLDIEINGEIRPGTEIGAHLSDAGSSLEGNTREISDFDMVYITLKDPLFDVTAGDQYVSWLPGGILTGNKKIKGLSVNVHRKLWHVGTFGALSGGKYAYEQFRAVTGIQGPYTLKGNGERGFIYPVTGTVKCRINGKLLDEGEDKNFTVDYDLGTISFTSKTAVTDDDIIKVEYEYKLFDFQRIVAGGSAGIHSSDSAIRVEGVIWSEFDNKNNPIDLSFTSEELRILKNSGDSPPQGTSFNAETVHPNDVAKEDAVRPLYKLRNTGTGLDYFEHVRYNRLKPDSSEGFYNVWFSKSGSGEGEYERNYSSYYKDYIYYYTGAGKGSYTPRISLTAPKRLTSGEMGIHLNYPLLKADINIVGQEQDKNLFSSINDNDNLSSSGRLNFTAGKKIFDRRSVWFTGKFSGTSRRFEDELISAWDRYNNWNDRSLDISQKQLLLWEAGSGVTFMPGLWTQFNYGQNRKASQIATDKVDNTTSYSINKSLNLTYNGSYYRHNPLHSDRYSHTQQIAAKFTPDKHEITTVLKEEWRKDSLHNGNGMQTAALEYMFVPWALRQQLSYDKLKHGHGEIFSSSDSGYQFQWDQSLKQTLFSIWDIDATTHFYRQVLKDHSKMTALLVDFRGELESESKRFSSQHSYRTNSERSTSYITVPIYAGKGLGTHILDTTRIHGDTTLDYFIPHVPGDWIIEQREASDKQSDAMMKKTLLTCSWSYTPPDNLNGFFGDLRWEGDLSCEEYVDAAQKGVTSWLPGVSSLRLNSQKRWSDQISYCDLSYRQDIDWTHPSNSNISVSLNSEPFLHQLLSYRETGIESGLSVSTLSKNSKIGYNLKYISLFHDDSSATDYDVYDAGLEFSQRFELKHGFGIYCQENAGIGKETRKDDLPPKQFILANQYYAQINPGVTFKLNSIGWAEASYTFSQVTIPGQYDYRIARGFSSGMSHVLSFTADFRIGKYFSVRGMYRGEFRKKTDQKELDNSDNVFSMEMKAFL